ncbi:hypothetical protein ACLOJK_024388 [Asimina triloba]
MHKFQIFQYLNASSTIIFQWLIHFVVRTYTRVDQQERNTPACLRPRQVNLCGVDAIISLPYSPLRELERELPMPILSLSLGNHDESHLNPVGPTHHIYLEYNKVYMRDLLNGLPFIQRPVSHDANSASGMAVSDECKLKFLELKAKRNYRFIVFKIDEKIQEVKVEKLGQPNESYDDFTICLPANECRYAVYDFDFTTNENCQKSKIFFIAWSPDTSKVRSKMLYASSKDRFKRELDGIQVELQATDPSEMSIDIIKGRAL